MGARAEELKRRLEGMRGEVEGWAKGEGFEGVEEKNEEVDREGGDAGGLYRD